MGNHVYITKHNNNNTIISYSSTSPHSSMKLQKNEEECFYVMLNVQSSILLPGLRGTYPPLSAS